MTGKLSLTFGKHAYVVRSNHAIAGELLTGSNTIDNSDEYPHYWPAKSYQKN